MNKTLRYSFLMLLMAVFSTSAFADEEIIDVYNFEDGSATLSSELTVSATNSTITLSAGTNTQSTPTIGKEKRLRFYNGNTIKFEANSGYKITKITFTANTSSGYGFGANNNMSADNGTFSVPETDTSNNKATGNWTAESTEGVDEVTLTSTKSKQFRISKIEVTLVSAAPTSETATITAAGKATWVPTATVKAADGQDVKAYIVTSVDNGYAEQTEVTVIPAGTPVLLEGAAGDYTFDVTDETADDVAANLLKVSDAAVTTNGTQYILANGSQGVGFYKAAGTIAAGKGYLEIAAAATAKNFIGFDATVTAISSIKAAEGSNAPVYNLAGQRVNAQYKGVVIQNGVKKVQK